MQIRPQAGAQELFLSTKADIAVYGGAAGSGKTYAILMEPIRHINNPKFRATFFRRNLTEITGQGGMWDSSFSLYPLLDATPRAGNTLDWTFLSGANIKFAHLNLEDDKYKYKGAEIALIVFDELTGFSEEQFFYLLSRNRSTCGVKPYIRATTNPDRDSWVRHLLDWWIDKDTGLAIPERGGVLRYFIRSNNELIWADTPEELLPLANGGKYTIKAEDVKSFTFIPATLADNKILLEKDSSYVSSLQAQNMVEQERLLHGNWNISYGDLSSVLSRKDFARYDSTLEIIYDKTYIVVDSANKTAEANDYSVIGVFGKIQGKFYIIDWYREKLEAPDLVRKIVDVKNKHHKLSIQAVYVERGSSGTSIMQFLREQRVPVFELNPIKDKFLRLNDVMGIIKSNYVHVPLNAPWAENFFIECECFRANMKHVLMRGETKPHDDQVDVLAYGLSDQTNTGIVRVVGRQQEPKRYISLFNHL